MIPMHSALKSSLVGSGFCLRGRRALVTGSSRGIGAAIAAGLAEAGADVAIHCVGRPDAAQAVAERCSGWAVRSGVVQADLAAPEGARIAAEGAAELLGGIDILVVNASYQLKRNWLEFSREEMERHFAVNYAASVDLLQRCLPGMADRHWGRVLTIGSVQERRPHPAMLIYSSLKHAQTGLMLGLARQYASAGVTINNLAPGVILTDRNADALADADYAEKVRTAIPAGFFGEPTDCVGAALLLCSDAGRYITGQNLFVDGGLGLP